MRNPAPPPVLAANVPEQYGSMSAVSVGRPPQPLTQSQNAGQRAMSPPQPPRPAANAPEQYGSMSSVSVQRPQSMMQPQQQSMMQQQQNAGQRAMSPPQMRNPAPPPVLAGNAPEQYGSMSAVAVGRPPQPPRPQSGILSPATPGPAQYGSFPAVAPRRQ
jgi:hypothetical protein